MTAPDDESLVEDLDSVAPAAHRGVTDGDDAEQAARDADVLASHPHVPDE